MCDMNLVNVVSAVHKMKITDLSGNEVFEPTTVAMQLGTLMQCVQVQIPLRSERDDVCKRN